MTILMHAIIVHSDFVYFYCTVDIIDQVHIITYFVSFFPSRYP